MLGTFSLCGGTKVYSGGSTLRIHFCPSLKSHPCSQCRLVMRNLTFWRLWQHQRLDRDPRQETTVSNKWQSQEPVSFMFPRSRYVSAAKPALFITAAGVIIPVHRGTQNKQAKQFKLYVIFTRLILKVVWWFETYRRNQDEGKYVFTALSLLDLYFTN